MYSASYCNFGGLLSSVAFREAIEMLTIAPTFQALSHEKENKPVIEAQKQLDEWKCSYQRREKGALACWGQRSDETRWFVIG
jgi:hypothetical protein